MGVELEMSPRASITVRYCTKSTMEYQMCSVMNK